MKMKSLSPAAAPTLLPAVHRGSWSNVWVTILSMVSRPFRTRRCSRFPRAASRAAMADVRSNFCRWMVLICPKAAVWLFPVVSDYSRSAQCEESPCGGPQRHGRTGTAASQDSRALLCLCRTRTWICPTYVSDGKMTAV